MRSLASGYPPAPATARVARRAPGNWVNPDRRRRDGGGSLLSEDERAELVRVRKENENAGLAMERDVLKRSVALWVRDVMGSR